MGKIRSKMLEKVAKDAALRPSQAVRDTIDAIRRLERRSSRSSSERSQLRALKTKLDELLDEFHPQSVGSANLKRSKFRGVLLNESTQIKLFQIIMIRASNYLKARYKDGEPTMGELDSATAHISLEIELANQDFDHTPDEDYSMVRFIPKSLIQPSTYDNKKSRDLIDEISESGFANCP